MCFIGYSRFRCGHIEIYPKPCDIVQPWEDQFWHALYCPKYRKVAHQTPQGLCSLDRKECQPATHISDNREHKYNLQTLPIALAQSELDKLLLEPGQFHWRDASGLDFTAPQPCEGTGFVLPAHAPVYSHNTSPWGTWPKPAPPSGMISPQLTPSPMLSQDSIPTEPGTAPKRDSAYEGSPQEGFMNFLDIDGSHDWEAQRDDNALRENRIGGQSDLQAIAESTLDVLADWEWQDTGSLEIDFGIINGTEAGSKLLPIEVD